MDVVVRELDGDARESCVALWHGVGPTRARNVPEDDFDRALRGPSSCVLGVVEDGVVVASAMVGHDGHRGWVYYLAVELAYQRSGFGAAVMSEAEEWVRRAGTTKIQLMVRSDNAHAEDFYRRRGYLAGDVTVFARDLE